MAIVSEDKFFATVKLWQTMAVFLDPHGKTPEQEMKCNFSEFVEILNDFSLDEIIDAAAFVEANEWESCNALMSTEGGFKGYYWRITRPRKKLSEGSVTNHIERLHAAAIYYESIGAWGTALVCRSLIEETYGHRRV